jgi:hypothetical protein
LKTVRKILLYAGLGLIILLTIAVALVFFYKDRIIKRFIEQANTHLNTPIKVKKIDISLFEHFPQLSIVMNDVYVEDSHPGEYPLLTAAKISFQLDAFDVWNGKYNVEGLRIIDSETRLNINERGKSNYNILKETKTGPGPQSVYFALQQVVLENTRVWYIDRTASQHMVFSSSNLVASISISNDIYDIHAEGQVTTDTLSIDGKSYSSGKSFVVESDLVYDDIKKHISIEPSSLRLKNSAFAVSGIYAWKDLNSIDLKFEGTDTDIQTILSLFPEMVYNRFERYRSKGDVYFNGKLKGTVSKSKSPSLSIDFGFNGATLYHPDYKSKITDASLKGSFATSDVTNTSVASLVLKDIKGVLNGEEFNAAFVLSNFNDPDVIFSFKGKVDAAALAELFPVENIGEVSGSLIADVSLEGKVGLLKKRATAQKVTTQGTIDMGSINMLVGKNRVPLQNLNGSLQFSNNDLALSNVSGMFGNSDFLLNGFFKNVITYLLFEGQPVGIETDLIADFVDLDQLLDIGYGATPAKATPDQDDKESTYKFNISKNVYLNFNCDVKRLRYKRFYAREINGDLLVKNQVAVSRNLAIQTMGGSLTLSGIVDATNNRAIDVVCTSRLKEIHLDSVFYVFQNFDQSFIEDRHLRGQVTADVNFELALDQNLRLYSETLTADIGAVIRNGELNNFEPMKKLNKYLDDEGLSKLRFSDLQNEIHIENKTVYIPQMQVRSNVTDIRVSGTHTFDQRIDYRLITPLRNRKKLDATESINAIEEAGNGQSKLFLKITGTTENYKISYDTEAVKKKIANDLKQEVQELKDAFRNKGTQEKKEQELEKDEYFDW